MNTNHYACANISAFHLYGAPFGMEDDDFIYPPDLLGSIDFEKEHVATYDPNYPCRTQGQTWWCDHFGDRTIIRVDMYMYLLNPDKYSF